MMVEVFGEKNSLEAEEAGVRMEVAFWKMKILMEEVEGK